MSDNSTLITLGLIEDTILEGAGPLGASQMRVAEVDAIVSSLASEVDPEHPGGKYFRIPPGVWWSIASLFDDPTSKVMAALHAPLALPHRVHVNGAKASMLHHHTKTFRKHYLEYLDSVAQQHPQLNEGLIEQLRAVVATPWKQALLSGGVAPGPAVTDEELSNWMSKQAGHPNSRFLTVADRSALRALYSVSSVLGVDDSVSLLLGLWAGARKSPRVLKDWERGIIWSQGNRLVQSADDLVNARVWLFTPSSPMRKEDFQENVDAFVQWAFRQAESWPNFRSPDPEIHAALRDRAPEKDAQDSAPLDPEAIPGWVKNAVQSGELRLGEPHVKISRRAPTVEDVWSELDQLEGLAQFKSELRQIAAQVAHRRALIDKGAVPDAPELSLVLLGNPGTGKTTGARIYGRLLKVLGLLPAGHLVETGRSDLVGSHVGETAKRVHAAFGAAKGGVLFIDEAYALARNDKDVYGIEAIDTITQLTEQMRGEVAVVVAGYSGPMAKFFDANLGLKGRFRDPILFPDIPPEALLRIVESRATSEGLTFGEGTRKAVEERLASIPRGEGFANAREARKLLAVMRERLALRFTANAENIAPEVLLPEDVPAVGLGTVDEKRFEAAQKALLGLVGIDTVKAAIVSRANQARLAHLVKEQGLTPPEANPGHMVFLGSPGTGKTTAAQYLGELYASIGLLASGHLVSRNREGLVGEYVGQTAPKVRAAIEEALDGVLFIDEAYALVNPGSPNDFGAEALATLIEGMERYRNRLLVVLAGYEQEMTSLLELNPGLKGRVSETIDFPDYTAEELRDISRVMAAGMRYPISDEAVDLLATRVFETRKQPGFANARDVRTLLEKAWANVANRIVGGGGAIGNWVAQIESGDVPHLTVKSHVPVGFQVEPQ